MEPNWTLRDGVNSLIRTFRAGLLMVKDEKVFVKVFPDNTVFVIIVLANGR